MVHGQSIDLQKNEAEKVLTERIENFCSRKPRGQFLFFSFFFFQIRGNRKSSRCFLENIKSETLRCQRFVGLNHFFVSFSVTLSCGRVFNF